MLLYEPSVRAMPKPPVARADIFGCPAYPNVFGTAYFYYYSNGLIVFTEVLNLPTSKKSGDTNMFTFAIYDSYDCRESDLLMNDSIPYNPGNVPFRNNPGFLGVLLANNGYALYATYTERISIDDIVGKAVGINALSGLATSPKIANGKILRIAP